RPRKENNISDIDNMSPEIHPMEEPPTFVIPTMIKYKIPKETEFNQAYEVVVALKLEYKNIKFSVKPNLVGDLILSPQDHNTAKILSEVTNLNRRMVKIIPLDPEEKTTRMVLLRYPLELPVEVIIKHPKVTKAERCVTKTSRLGHIMPREERADESFNGKNTTTKHNRSTPQHIRVGLTATENSQPNTQLSEDSFPAFPPPGYRTKLKTPGQNQSMQETMTNQWTPQLQLQSCIAVKAQNTPVLVENIILPGTLQPHQATTQLNTPQPANLQAAFTEEQIKQMITIMIVTVSTIIKKQDTSTENIINAVMTQLTEKMQEDQTAKTPQLQVEQTTPLSQISDKKILPSERSLKTVKPQAPCNRSRGTEQQAQTVSKHTITGKSDSTLKRAEKTPEIPPKTSGIPPPAPPLEQVPKKQPPMSTPFLTDEESDSTMNAVSNYSTSDEEIMIE
ncbi:putative RNA-directed DNA polymerase from mobile element jockey-like 59, partial [Homarus americanus]